MIACSNKKVLLCERKRHTDRGVSSTPSVVPVPRGGGGTHPALDGGYPHPWTDGGTPPHPRLDVVPPSLSLDGGTPPSKAGWGNTPSKAGWGYPPSKTGWGYPTSPSSDGGIILFKAGWGYPLAGPDRGTPRPLCGQTDGQTHVKTLPSRRTTYAVGNYTIDINNLIQ